MTITEAEMLAPLHLSSAMPEGWGCLTFGSDHTLVRFYNGTLFPGYTLWIDVALRIGPTRPAFQVVHAYADYGAFPFGESRKHFAITDPTVQMHWTHNSLTRLTEMLALFIQRLDEWVDQSGITQQLVLMAL